jgi:hypothetical protein
MPEHEKNCFDRPDNGKNQAKLTVEPHIASALSCLPEKP